MPGRSGTYAELSPVRLLFMRMVPADYYINSRMRSCNQHRLEFQAREGESRLSFPEHSDDSRGNERDHSFNTAAIALCAPMRLCESCATEIRRVYQPEGQ